MFPLIEKFYKKQSIKGRFFFLFFLFLKEPYRFILQGWISVITPYRPWLTGCNRKCNLSSSIMQYKRIKHLQIFKYVSQNALQTGSLLLFSFLDAMRDDQSKLLNFVLLSTFFLFHDCL